MYVRPMCDPCACHVLCADLVEKKTEAKVTWQECATLAIMTRTWTRKDDVTKVQKKRNMRLLPELDFGQFRLDKNAAKRADRQIRKTIETRELETWGIMTLDDELAKSPWDKDGKQVILKWRDVAPVLVPGAFIEDTVVYRGCLYCVKMAKKLRPEIKLRVTNPAWTNPIMIRDTILCKCVPGAMYVRPMCDL